MLVAVILWQSVILVGARIPFTRMIYINAITQLSKYLPGSIWQYIGRAGYYRLDGNMELKQTARAILVEAVWLVSSSMIAAIIFYSIYLKTPLGFIFIIVVVWGLLLKLVHGRLTKQPTLWKQILTYQGTQFLIWLCFGISFYILFADFNTISSQLFLILATFSISWTIGYVVFFAPGGIGIRELVIITLLGHVFPNDVLLAYLTVHRLLAILVEAMHLIVSKAYLSHSMLSGVRT